MKKTLSVFLLFAAACGRIEAPAPLFPVPNARQLAWQQLETYAFVPVSYTHLDVYKRQVLRMAG